MEEKREQNEGQIQQIQALCNSLKEPDLVISLWTIAAALQRGLFSIVIFILALLFSLRSGLQNIHYAQLCLQFCPIMPLNLEVSQV